MFAGQVPVNLFGQPLLVLFNGHSFFLESPLQEGLGLVHDYVLLQRPDTVLKKNSEKNVACPDLISFLDIKHYFSYKFFIHKHLLGIADIFKLKRPGNNR